MTRIGLVGVLTLCVLGACSPQIDLPHPDVAYFDLYAFAPTWPHWRRVACVRLGGIPETYSEIIYRSESLLAVRRTDPCDAVPI